MGIRNLESQNRFQGVYLDFTDLVLVGNGANLVTVANSFFLGGAQVVFETAPKQTSVAAVTLAGNEWYDTGSAALAVNEAAGAWTSVVDFSSDVPYLAGQPYAGATAAQRVDLPAGQDVGAITALDFSAQLLFPSVPIDSVVHTALSLGPVDVGAYLPPSLALNVTGPAQQAVAVARWSAHPPLPAQRLLVTVDQSSHTSVQVIGARVLV